MSCVVITQNKAVETRECVKVCVVSYDRENMAYWHKLSELLSGAELLEMDVMVRPDEHQLYDDIVVTDRTDGFLCKIGILDGQSKPTTAAEDMSEILTNIIVENNARHAEAIDERDEEIVFLYTSLERISGQMDTENLSGYDCDLQPCDPTPHFSNPNPAFKDIWEIIDLARQAIRDYRKLLESR